MNHAQKEVLVRKIKERFGGGLSDKVFAAWGLAFKPDTDDMRESPAITIPKELTAAGVVSNFIVQALKGGDITIYGDGTQTRSFCYVDDLVEGMVRMMNSRDGFTGPVNLGNPGEFTMLELAKKVISLTDSKSKTVYQPLPQDDPTQRKPMIDLAKKELGWESGISLDEGLIKTIEYFKCTGSMSSVPETLR